MSWASWRRGAVSACCLLVAGAASGQEVSLEEFPKLRVADLGQVHRDWLEREVMWIITATERDAFLRLPSEERRAAFVERFWQQRDPTPGTLRNEYRELHAARLAHADREYGRETGRAGRLTDRGKMSIVLGAPQSVARFSGSPVAVPIEIWSYAVDPALGVPPFFDLLFFRQRGIGEHRLYSPLADGPESLLNPAGINEATSYSANNMSGRVTRATQFGDLAGVLQVLSTVDLALAQSSLSLVPGEPASLGMAPLRSESLLAELASLPDRILADPNWALRMLVGAVDSDVRFETIPVQLSAATLVDPEGFSYLHFAVRLPGDRLNFGDYQGRYYGTYEITVAVRDEQLRFPVAPEPRTVELELEPDQVSALKTSPFVHLGRVPIEPGQYTIDVTVENNVGRMFGRAEATVVVPAARPGSVRSSEPFLATEYDSLGEAYDPYLAQVPFQVGQYFMMPALDGPFVPSSTVWVFHQIYAPTGSHGSLAARYSIVDAQGTVVAEKTSVLDLGNVDRFGVLSQLAGVPLAGLAPGAYRLRADLDGDDRPVTELPLTLVAEGGQVAPIPHATVQPPPTDPDELLRRARQLRTLGRSSEAIETLRGVLARDPDQPAADALLAELLSESGRLPELATLWRARLVENPHDQQLLLSLAEVEGRRGNTYDAIRYYERALLQGASEDPALLNGLAAAYLAEGTDDRARALLTRSLEIDPSQPAIRVLRDRIAKPRE